MNTGIFKFSVFRRRRPACRAVAALSSVALAASGAIPAYAAAPTQVLSDTGLGGASYNRAVGARIAPNASLTAA